MDNHFYAWYKGNLSNIIANPTSDGITKCTFKDQEIYCYFNESKTPVNDGKFYYSKCRYGRLIIPINSIIMTQYEVEKPETKPQGIKLNNFGKGRYGCIPKFINNGNGEIEYTIVKGIKVITLHIARHDMMNDINETILELEPHFFPISDNDYCILNKLFIKDKNIEGGVDSRSLNILNVFNANGSSISIPMLITNPPHPNN